MFRDHPIEVEMLSEKATEVLRSTTLFAGFSQEQLEEVPKVARPRTFEPGEVIVAEGELGAGSLWLIVEGEVEIRVGGKLLRTEGPGAHIGELALLTDAPRSADVVAAKQTTALQLTRDHLRGLIHANPDVAMSIMAELAQRLRNLTVAVAEILRASPEATKIAAEQGIESLAGRPDPHLGPIEFALDSDSLEG